MFETQTPHLLFVCKQSRERQRCYLSVLFSTVIQRWSSMHSELKNRAEVEEQLGYFQS